MSKISSLTSNFSKLLKLEKQHIEISMEVYEDVSKLPDIVQDLMNKAQEARENAYAPYSHFRVGVAIRLASGEIVIGNNQENAAYPSGLCAERVAIFYVGAAYPNEEIVEIAITARSQNQVLDQPIGPCGACRQSMLEYEQKQKKPIAVYFTGETGGVIKVDSIKDFLPFGFDATYL